MRTIDKIGLLSLIIAGVFFLFNVKKMNVDENEWRLNWKKLNIHGVVVNIEMHYKSGEKKFFIYSIFTNKSIVKIVDYGVDDSSFFVYLKKGDSISKYSGSLEFELYKSDTLFNRFCPIKDIE